MLTPYIRAAMHRAQYEILPDDGTFHGHIPEFNGVWANAGARHQFMKRGEIALRLPNPHRGDIGVDLLIRLLREAEIERDEWERL